MKQICLLFAVFVLFGTGINFAQDDLDKHLSALLEYYVNPDDPGVVLYVHYAGDEAVAVRGLADLEAATPMREADLFRLASISKSFVATVVLQLVGEHQIELDNPIADYVPAKLAQNIANADVATVRQVLQMTSGIYNYTDTDAFYDAVYADPDYPWTAEETLTFIYDEEPYFAPGEGYFYSNSNYNLAQIAIENVTGNALADELEARIFAPLGMNSCYLETPDVFAENIVRGYEANDDNMLDDVTEINDGTGLGDGGIVCSAADLARFLPSLMNGKLLDATLLNAMLDIVDDGAEGAYGLGLAYSEGDFGSEIWHDGAASGFQSYMTYLPDEDLTLVILTNNFDSEIMADLAYDALALVFDI
jgi:D-alanyl-D-alanine carboxypeptidase